MHVIKSITLKFSFALLFISVASNAQLSLIYDKDGYVNVRESQSVKSKVIGKVVEGQVFCVSDFDDTDHNSEWQRVWVPVNPDPKIKDFLRYRDVNEKGYIHKSRILHLDKLKYFALTNQTPNKSYFKNKQIEVSVEIKPFDKTKHHIVKSKDGDYQIDHVTDFWSLSSSMPRNEFKSVKIVQDNNTYVFPKEALSNLYDLNVENVSLFIGNNDEIYLNLSGADGSDSYEIVWCLKNNKIFSMTVMQIIP